MPLPADDHAVAINLSGRCPMMGVRPSGNEDYTKWTIEGDDSSDNEDYTKWAIEEDDSIITDENDTCTLGFANE